MTNGTVKADAPAPRVKSAMTNGTVSGSATASGARTLTVTYKDGAQTVVGGLPETPVVTFEPADRRCWRPAPRPSSWPRATARPSAPAASPSARTG